MVKTESKIPELRFPEFEGEWSKIKIRDVAKVTSGGTPNRQTRKYWGGKIPWITTSLINFNRIQASDEFITNEGLNNSSVKLFPKGTVLMALYGQGVTRGKVAILDFDATTNQACAAILFKEDIVKNEYGFYELQRRYDSLRNLSNDGSQKNLSGNLIKGLSVHFPTLPEQQKIATYLTAIDDKIQQLTKKIALLQDYKKGVMQQLFSQQIRFKPDLSEVEGTDDGSEFPEWEFIRGKHLFRSHSNKDHNGDLPILAATQNRGVVYRESIGIAIQSSQASVNSYKIVERGDFVISLRSFQGGIEYSEVHGICSPAYIILKPKIEISLQYFKFYFKKEDFIERLSKTVVGIRDGKQISYEAFSGLKLPLPCLEEQQKIADFLTAIDTKIEQVKTQLEQSKTFKKGLLQKMFV